MKNENPRGCTARCQNLPNVQRGVTLVEVTLVIAALLIVLGIMISYATNMGKASQRQQLSDQEAREIAMLSKATDQYIAANPTLFALNTNVPITTAQLLAGGHIPAGFANRAGTGTAISPFGQPYVIVARKIAATDPATAVITESGSALPEKLPTVGIENAVEAILGLKRDIAGRVSQDYDVIAGTIPAGSRVAQGVGGAFTKDLTAYFTGNFGQAAPVGLVNFKDLEPTDPNDPNDPNNPNIVRRKVFNSCYYDIKACNGNFCPNWDGLECRDSPSHPELGPGIHHWRSSRVSNCTGTAITPMEFGGAMTNGYTEVRRTGGDQCPDSNPACENLTVTGSVTMNNLTIASGQCRVETWVGGVIQTTNYDAKSVGVCCTWRWDPDYPPAAN